MFLMRFSFPLPEGRIAVRDDRSPWADVGLREHLVATLKSFSDNWLRLGLETIFGELLSAKMKVDRCVAVFPCPPIWPILVNAPRLCASCRLLVQQPAP